jgi:hypothetical protein
LSGKGGAAGNGSLTGYWSGEYWYESGLGPRTSFAAHISETGGSIEGTTLESRPAALGGGEVSASILGLREGSSVSFMKRYQHRPGVHQFPIFYGGSANADLTMIEGEWTIPAYGDWRGGFRMRRGSGAAKVAVKRKARVPVKAGGQ